MKHFRAKPHPSKPRRPRRRADARYFIGRADELAPGECFKFIMPIDGVDEECFAINFRGVLRAYVNRCRHVPMALDWLENQFFTSNGSYIMCQTHNACYDPVTGECVSGPQSAYGKFLFEVPLQVENGKLYAWPPEESLNN